MIEHAGTEALESCGVSIGFEASGQLGVVRATVSRVLLPEAACDVAYVTCTVHGENSSCGRVGTARFCERVGGASALPRPPAGWAQKNTYFILYIIYYLIYTIYYTIYAIYYIYTNTTYF